MRTTRGRKLPGPPPTLHLVKNRGPRLSLYMGAPVYIMALARAGVEASFTLSSYWWRFLFLFMEVDSMSGFHTYGLLQSLRCCMIPECSHLAFFFGIGMLCRACLEATRHLANIGPFTICKFVNAFVFSDVRLRLVPRTEHALQFMP